jgi:hypothetical protein
MSKTSAVLVATMTRVPVSGTSMTTPPSP